MLPVRYALCSLGFMFRHLIWPNRKLFASLVPPSQTAPSPPSYSAYLYLAQLTDSDPRAALSQYQAAVDLLLLLIKGKERIQPSELNEMDRNSDASLRRTVISALVAMVEIWMSSDLWYVHGLIRIILF